MESERLSNLEQSKDERKAKQPGTIERMKSANAATKVRKAKRALEDAQASIITHAQKAADKPKTALCGAKAFPKQIILGGAFRRDASRITCRKCLELHERILAATKRTSHHEPTLKRDDWDKLFTLISEFTEAAIGDSWKGGGDPAEYEIHELRLKLARTTLNYHIYMMKAKHT